MGVFSLTMQFFLRLNDFRKNPVFLCICKKINLYILLLWEVLQWDIVDIAPWIVLAASICGLAFAMYKFFWVKKQPEGTKEMANISAKTEKRYGVFKEISIRQLVFSLSLC